jgi:hypothetical protein
VGILGGVAIAAHEGWACNWGADENGAAREEAASIAV